MKKYDICIDAFVMGNLGDDLFVCTLCARYPNTNFVMCGKKTYRNCYIEIPNLTYLCTDNFSTKWKYRFLKLPARLINNFREKKGLKVCFNEPDLFRTVSKKAKENVLISGSIFIEKKGATLNNKYYIAQKAYYLRHPYVMGCNFGPYYSKEYIEFYSGCFANAKQVSFREKCSKDLFTGEHIFNAKDILFSLDKSIAKKPKIDNYVLISLINPDKDGVNQNNNSKSYIDKITDFVNELVNKNIQVVLMGFCNAQGDNSINEIVLNSVKKNDNITIVNYPDINMEEALGYIANARFVVATRYHAMILGMLYDKPVLPVVYSKKMSNVINEINKDMISTSLDKIQEYDFISLADDIAGRNINKYLVEDIDSCVADSNKHFIKLDEIYK